MIPIQTMLINGSYETRWTSGNDIYKEYYQDLSSSDQCILNDIYHNYNRHVGRCSWEDFILKYDNKIALKHWKIFFFLGGNNDYR